MDEQSLLVQQQAERAGVVRTVYSLIYPETRAITRAMWRHADSERLHELFEQAWTRRQDPMHIALFDAWLAWSAPVLSWNPAEFPHRYPCSGSSEAIRDAIAHLATHHRGARLHVFQGDYEGYEALAAAFALPVVHHDRSRFETIATDPRFGRDDVFVFSQPSSLDGNIWPHCAQFLADMQRHGRLIWLDLCYVGCVARPYRLELSHPNIDKLFWSLSKVFGVYYHRIGGVFSRTAMPGLHGNMWFKNLHSIELGRRLLAASTVHQLPRAYAPLQAQAVAQAAQLLGDDPPLCASDVVLLASRPVTSATPSAIDRAMLRAAGTGAAVARYCLTPFMGQRLGSDTDTEAR